MLSKEQEILLKLFRDFLADYNSRNLSKIVGISHAGAFKILKKLEERKIVKSKKIGKAVIYSINQENQIALKEIELDLMIEAQNYKRWLEEFSKLQKEAEFVILFGSLIKNEKAARDIDLLVVAKKSKFMGIKESINEKNKLLPKKIHLIIQTLEEFRFDIKNNNKTLIEIIKTGIILFGQDKFVGALK